MKKHVIENRKSEENQIIFFAFFSWTNVGKSLYMNDVDMLKYLVNSEWNE